MKANMAQKFVIQTVEQATGLNDITQHTRKREYVDARRIAYLIMRKLYGTPYYQIAKLFNRNHATVIYGVSTAQNLMDTDASFRENYFETLAEVSGGGSRMSEIVLQIKELKKEFLTLQKSGYEL
jgi:chromosomal replication initiation ATPase DnaA